MKDDRGLYDSVMRAADREDDCRNLFVRNIPSAATSDQLKGAFQPFGTLVDCMIVYDKASRASKGYGFVKFDSALSALKAIDAEVRILDAVVSKNFACLHAKSVAREAT